MNLTDIDIISSFPSSYNHDQGSSKSSSDDDHELLFNYLKNKLGKFDPTSEIENLLEESLGKNTSKLRELFKFLSYKSENYKSILIRCLKKTESASLLQFVTDDLRNDIEVARVSMTFKESVKYISNRETMLQLLKGNYWNLALSKDFRNISKKFETDDEIIRIILSMECNNDLKLKITDNFRSDANLEEVYSKRYWFIKYADDSLRNNEEFILKVIEKNPRSMEFIPNHFINDKKFIERAIQLNLNCFKYASNQFKNDRDLVLKVLELDAKLYEYISNELQQDIEIVKGCVKRNGSIYALIPSKFKNDREMVFSAFVDGCSELNSKVKTKWIERNFQEINSRYRFIFRNVPKHFKSDRELALKLVDLFGYSLNYLDKAFRSDREIVLKAVMSYASSIALASLELLRDKEVLASALIRYDNFYSLARFVPDYIRNRIEYCRDKEIVSYRNYNCKLDKEPFDF